MKKDRGDILGIVEEGLKEDKDMVISEFGTFSIDDSGRAGKTVVFTPSENFLERLDDGLGCPQCNSRNVEVTEVSRVVDTLIRDWQCQECGTTWREQI